ncbi:uncharacterized protein LOC132203406 [Neocloeon triangulifer]|uniref:uncharacterized protein LOC132203406 n=1 Tax=Neocloeon triangulifer TaxID=2078957 RepID=UPI00286F3D42|nr:uncharacterized protein LOC132203406 [Neocloeon triangulifer]
MANKMSVSTIEGEAASMLSPLGAPSCADTKMCSSEDDELTNCDNVPSDPKSYPFALVLRLRVMQIVCGISAMVMGTVALIEERGQMNLGLGVPAGGVVVLAASLSIHCSRGFGGYEPSGCSCAKLRWLGPNPRTAALLAALWGTALLLVGALGVRATLTLFHSGHGPFATDVHILALVQLSLVLLVVGGALVALRVDCSRDPD